LPRVLFEIQGRKVFRWIPVSRVVLEFGLKVGPLLFGKLIRNSSLHDFNDFPVAGNFTWVSNSSFNAAVFPHSNSAA
jgi:hypothetical protein